jgi:hypothetical protein
MNSFNEYAEPCRTETDSLPSVGDSRLRDLRSERVAINFDAPAPRMPMATEVAALGAFERHESRSCDPNGSFDQERRWGTPAVLGHPPLSSSPTFQ